MNSSVGITWIKIAAIYFVLAIALGLVMGASHDYSLRSVHAHIALFGWASLAIIGLIYCHFPAIANNRLAKVQFWLHNLGLPCLNLAIIGVQRGNTALEPIIGIASTVVAISVILFAVNIFKNMKS
ncbi:MAG: hypothetical protein Q8R10_11210 [Pseudomonas sp.]|uniref:hypothetical protein n=1 Tax=Pseudomonas sp. TaxID=306 RepID=UPI002732EB7E|nr:hypothetical protein [Pseudomonas sp.]MDP3846975.1 hypothetical protein [Pseudomonas sp.]